MSPTLEIGRLMAIASQAGIAANVRFEGRRGRDQLRYYYSAADVFVTTPWYEPFGITPIEAMACGTPVIGADVGGIKWSVKDGITGFLIPPNDPNALAARLNELFASPARRRQMGQAAIKRAQALFTWSGVTQSLVAAYQEVLNHQREGAQPMGLETADQHHELTGE